MSFLERFLTVYYRSGMRGSYRLTDILAGRIRSLQKVAIKTDNGVLFADLRINSARGLLAVPNPESGESVVMRQFVKPGDVVFDIGAHLGVYTLLLSKLVGPTGQVHAFEPNPELLPSLRATIANLPNVELHAIALSDKSGELMLHIPEDASMASLKDWTDGSGGDVHSVSCRVCVLDSLVTDTNLPRPSFIKCDVEGGELSIFKGAVAILNRPDAPVLLFELNRNAAISFGQDTPSYLEFLESLDSSEYQFYEALPDGLRRLETRTIEYANILAIPISTQVDAQLIK